MRQILFLITTSFLILSCASSKQNNWLNDHRDALKKTKLISLSTEEKLDILLESYVTMMHQSLDFLNPKKGAAFAEKYNQENKDLIMNILEDANADLGDLSRSEKIRKGLSMMGKPYTKDLVELFPRFQRKYKFLNSITDVNKRIKEVILEKLGL